MITSKRKIETEQDRFGGYEESVSTERSVFRAPETIQIHDGGRVFGRTARNQNAIYSTRTQVEKPFSEPEIGKVRSTPLSEEDLMPSIKTMAYAEPKKKVDSREAFEAKTRVMLAVYLAIVVVLAAIVIGTGIVINSLSANITRLNGQIEQSQGVIAQQNIELAKLDDPYAIAGKAKDPNGLNMEEIVESELIPIDIIPFISEPADPPKASGFDAFCDWVKDLLGN